MTERSNNSSLRRLMRSKPAADYLGVSTKAVRQMVLAGELRAIPGNGLRSPWRFDVRDLDEWIERSKVGYPKAAR